MMSSRETILTNIKQNLKGVSVLDEPLKIPLNEHSMSAGELVDRFGIEFKKIDCEMVRCKNHDEAVKTICAMTGVGSQQKIMVSKDPLLTDNTYEEKIKTVSPNFSVIKYNQDVASVDSSVVVASYAIAETATIVLRSSPSQIRSLSLLPETVFVIAKESQLYLSMGEVLKQLQNTGALKETSALIFVTGSSRTTDIEKTLVRGVHGPKRLVVVFVP